MVDVYTKQLPINMLFNIYNIHNKIMLIVFTLIYLLKCCRHLVNRWKKVIEAILVCCFTATVGFLLMLWRNECKPLSPDTSKHAVQVCIHCIIFKLNVNICR